jgi:alkylation response protein AidB-like acyl-CoA dehydrogenase
MAQAARDYAIAWASNRSQIPFDRPVSHYPGNQFLAAEMEVGLRAARAMLVQTASAVGEPAIRANPPPHGPSRLQTFYDVDSGECGGQGDAHRRWSGALSLRTA